MEILMTQREPTALVQVKVRMRETLRARLEEVANRRHVSINAEIVDRLEYLFDRGDLFPQVLSLAYGRPLGGIVMMLGFAMDAAGRSIPNIGYNWINHPDAFDYAVEAAIALLNAARPHPLPARRRRGVPPYGLRMAREMISALRDRKSDRNLPSPFLLSDVTTLRSMLGPIADRMAKAAETKRIPRMGTPQDMDDAAFIRSRKAMFSVAITAAADAILDLINSSPRTPSRQALVEEIEKQFLPHKGQSAILEERKP